jgi:hypothetical protein
MLLLGQRNPIETLAFGVSPWMSHRYRLSAPCIDVSRKMLSSMQCTELHCTLLTKSEEISSRAVPQGHPQSPTKKA